jgi:hypothetical protein
LAKPAHTPEAPPASKIAIEWSLPLAVLQGKVQVSYLGVCLFVCVCDVPAERRAYGPKYWLSACLSCS